MRAIRQAFAALLPLAVAVMVPGSPVRADITLVERGESRAEIVLPDTPSFLERKAAAELQHYLGAMGGAPVPIALERDASRPVRILVGGTEAGRGIVPEAESKAQGPEGFVIRTRGGDVVIAGGGGYGTLYGAYELLEKYLGVRWYLPDPLGEIVPQRSVVKLPRIDDSQRPAFEMRWVGGDDQWCLRNKMNRVRSREYPPAFRVEPGIYHTQRSLVPPGRYYSQHPEYFALIDGKRSGDADAKLCYSNPEVSRVVAANLAALKRADPSIALLSFSPTDGQKWCECDGCKAMDDAGDVPSDQRMSRRSLVFYNRVASELAAQLPGQRLLVGAYNVYNRRPKDPRVEANPNLAVIITHYDDYCMAHPVNDPACPRNARYAELVKAWQRLIPSVYFYEYYHKANWLDLPWPIVHCISADIPYFRDLGIKGLYTQYSARNVWTNVLDYYVAAKLLWNPDADVGALLEDFYRGFYGEAARPMKAYYDTLERAMADAGHFPGNAFDNATRVFTEPVLKGAGERLAQARRIARDPDVKARIGKAQASYEYARRLCAYFRLADSLAGIGDPAKLRREADRAEKMAADLLADLQQDRGRYEGVAAGALNPHYRSLLMARTEQYSQPARRRAAELGLVTDWMIIGPFDNADMKGHGQAYPPESAICLGCRYQGKAGPVGWLEHHNPPWDGYVDLARILRPKDWVCAYALAYARAPAPTAAQVRVGSNDSIAVWLGGEKVLDRNVQREARMDDDVVEVVIPEGVTPVLLKVCQSEMAWGFYFRITGSDGEPVKKLRFAPSPGGAGR